MVNGSRFKIMILKFLFDRIVALIGLLILWHGAAGVQGWSMGAVGGGGYPSIDMLYIWNSMKF